MTGRLCVANSIGHYMYCTQQSNMPRMCVLITPSYGSMCVAPSPPKGVVK